MSFLSALAQKNSGRLPVWFMRQAGRYLPEYQALRKKYDFRTMSHDPKLICETTMTPFARYDLDGAIMFSDILTCLEYMGSAFHFGADGPVLEDHGPQILSRLTPLNPSQDMAFVGEGIRLAKKELGSKPLIGFAGAPFTLISYLVEGGTSREFTDTRMFIYERPEEFQKTLNLLGESIAEYLLYQISCGADAVQIFDSWVGILPHTVYKDLVAPTMSKLITKVKSAGKPVILYSQPTSHLVKTLSEFAPTALSVDWRESLSDVVNKIKPENVPTLQGNLDPIVTTLEWDKAKPYVVELLEEVSRLNLRKQYIFNVGHGVTPETKWETLGSIINFVHEYKI